MRNEVIFDDVDLPSQNYTFTRGNSRKVEQEQMTSEFSTKETAMETLIHNSEKESIEVQIDSKGFRDNSEEVTWLESNEEDDKKLLKFLKRMEPIIRKEIEEGLNQKAYQNYEPDPSAQRQDTKVLYTLEDHSKMLSSATLCVSDVSWNSAGMVVAAGYGEFVHEGSCNHRGAVCTWSIFKREFRTNTPQIIETSGCISCLSFHPVKPSMLVCGTYSGEILLYDLAREDDNLIARSRIDDYLHREVISKLIWWEYRVPGSYDTIYNLLSLGTDGKILLWDMRYNDKHKKQLLQNPIKGFSLLRKKDSQIVPVGGLSMEMSPENKTVFAVGSEGGSVLRATLSNIMLDMESKALLDRQTNVKFPGSMYPFLLNLIPQNLPQIKYHVEQYCQANKLNEASMAVLFQSKPDIRKLYPNAVNFVYETAPSPVVSISYNKYGLFVVNGCEGSSRIYLEGFKKNLQNIDGGYQIKWIAPTKLAGFFEDQWVVFDWFTGDVMIRIGASHGIQWIAAGEMAAVAYDQNKIKIVRLGSNITEPPAGEEALVDTKITELKGF